MSGHANLLKKTYHLLYSTYGPQDWWPAESPFEVAVGAILTQSVSWSNVEMAILNLKRAGLMDPVSIARCDEHRLAEIIRPSGYYNAKAKKLRAFTCFLVERFNGDLNEMFEVPRDELRRGLLAVYGIGPETADSILCYAGDFPVFVADAYSRRILRRMGLVAKDSYVETKQLVEGALPEDPYLFNEFHALLVCHAKQRCRKRAPLCAECVLLECPRIGVTHEGNPIQGSGEGDQRKRNQEARAFG